MESSVSVEHETALVEEALSHLAVKKIQALFRKKAMDLLARREHAVLELQQKLLAYARKKDFDVELADKVVEDLQGEGLLSDERFTEAFVRYRTNNGHGPMRIQTELRERGVNEKIRASWLNFADPQWFERAAQVRNKRFGNGLPEDFKERARQARFLQYRGFTTDQIKLALAGGNYDDD